MMITKKLDFVTQGERGAPGDRGGVGPRGLPGERGPIGPGGEGGEPVRCFNTSRL